MFCYAQYIPTKYMYCVEEPHIDSLLCWGSNAVFISARPLLCVSNFILIIKTLMHYFSMFFDPQSSPIVFQICLFYAKVKKYNIYKVTKLSEYISTISLTILTHSLL